MNCHETYLWMLEAEEPAALPPASITEHLRACSKCRRRQKRVLRLLTAVEQLPPPPDNPQARAQVLSLVRQTPVAPTPRPPLRSPRRSRRWLWSVGLVLVAAALLLALFGWLFSAFHSI